MAMFLGISNLFVELPSAFLGTIILNVVANRQFAFDIGSRAILVTLTTLKAYSF